MTAPTIRRMQPAELEPVVALWRRSRDEVQPWLEARMGHSREGDRRFFGEVILEQHEVWLAVEGDRAVGFMALSPGFVEHLYVDPPEQGRGVGGALLAFALTRSPRELSLYTHQRNLRARRFYERRGFRAVAFGVSPLPECEPDVLYRWRPSDPSGERGDAPGQQELRAEVERQPPDGIDETG